MVMWLMCGVNSNLSEIRTPRMLSSLTRFTPGTAGGMQASFIASRWRRTIISQFLATLSERLSSGRPRRHIVQLNSHGMRLGCRLNQIRVISIFLQRIARLDGFQV